jgi:hypothetical protein
VTGAVDLEEHPGLAHPLPALPGTGRSPSAHRRHAVLVEDPAQRPGGHGDPLALGEQVREVRPVDAGIGGGGELDEPLAQLGRHPVRRRTAAVPVHQGGHAIGSAVPGQQPPHRAQAHPEQRRGIRGRQLTDKDMVEHPQALLRACIQRDRLPRVHVSEGDKVAGRLAVTDSLAVHTQGRSPIDCRGPRCYTHLKATRIAQPEGIHMQRLTRHGTFRRLIASLSMVAVVATLAPAAGSAAATGACQNDANPLARWYGVVTRDASDLGYNGFVGAIGEAVARPLTLCSGGNENDTDFVAVLPVNMQDPSGNIIQMGMWNKRSTGFHFIYSYSGDGTFLRLDDWVGGPPQVGHRYRFKINLYGTNLALASFCVRDVTDNGDYLCRSDRPNPVGLASFAWWGVEINDWNSGMGPVLGDGYLSMRWFQYNPQGNVDWQVAWPNTAEKIVQFVDANHPFKAKWAVYTEDFAFTKDQLQNVSTP